MMMASCKRCAIPNPESCQAVLPWERPADRLAALPFPSRKMHRDVTSPASERGLFPKRGVTRAGTRHAKMQPTLVNEYFHGGPHPPHLSFATTTTTIQPLPPL